MHQRMWRAVVTGALFFSATFAQATIYTWTGGVDNDWNNAANWDGSGIPAVDANGSVVNSANTITIQNGLNNPVVNVPKCASDTHTLSASSPRFVIDPGASLSIRAYSEPTATAMFAATGVQTTVGPGGSLTYSSDTHLAFGRNTGTQVHHINGGTFNLNVASYLYMGWQGGNLSEINLDGGTLNTTATRWYGSRGTGDFSTGASRVNLNNGSHVNAASTPLFNMQAGDDPTLIFDIRDSASRVVLKFGGSFSDLPAVQAGLGIYFVSSTFPDFIRVMDNSNNTFTITLDLSTLPVQEMIIESLTGEVTRAEIDSFKDYLKYYVTPGTNNIRNELVYGPSGTAIEALGLMYEVTGDIAILDRMIQFADAALSGRNDPDTGEVIWTGNRELVWPNPETGSEQGDIIGHIAYCAKLILKTPSIFNVHVGAGDSHGYGTTYRERALTYITEADRTAATYIIPNLITMVEGRPRYYWPSYYYVAENAGKPIPWNQQMMLNNGFQRLAECHEILGDHPDLTARYDSYVQSSIDWFLSRCGTYPSSSGKDCYSWAYSAFRDVYAAPEDAAHGNYDVWGMCRAYFSGRYNLSSSDMIPFANTFSDVMTLGTNLFLNRVYPTSYGTQNFMYMGYLFLGAFDTDIYRTIAAANISAGGRQNKSIGVTATILWMKHALDTGKIPFNPGWQAEDIGPSGVAGSFSYGYDSGVFTVRGGGAGIDGGSDQFNFAYQTTPGDRTLTARILDIQNAHADTRAGLMIRDSNSASSAYVGVFATPDNQVVMKCRAGDGLPDRIVASSSGFGTPLWMRLTRSGDIFAAFYSTNNISWTQLGQIQVAMINPVSTGLAVTAGTNTLLSTTTFDHVKLAAAIHSTVLRITGMTRPAANQVVLNWHSVSGQVYQVEIATDLQSGFSPLSGELVSADNSSSYTDTSADSPVKFYRIRLVPQEL